MKAKQQSVIEHLTQLEKASLTTMRPPLVTATSQTTARMVVWMLMHPMEVLKMLIGHCANNQSRNHPFRLATIDVKGACFYAPVAREVYVKLPAEDMLPGESDMVGRLRVSVYGTRDAAQTWMKHYSGKLRYL